MGDTRSPTRVCFYDCLPDVPYQSDLESDRGRSACNESDHAEAEYQRGSYDGADGMRYELDQFRHRGQ